MLSCDLQSRGINAHKSMSEVFSVEPPKRRISLIILV